MKYVVLASALLLSGCFTLPQKEPETVVKVEYITKLPPKELLALPPKNAQPPVNDKGEMMQSDIAVWVLEQEKRMRQLENMIIGIGKFYYQDNN